MKNKNRKRIVYILVGIFILGFSLFYRFDAKIKDSMDVSHKVIKLKENDIVEKEFVSQYNDMNYVAVQFATYQNPNIHGEMKITIKEKETEKIIYDNRVDFRNLKDNTYYILPFEKQKESKNKIYQITIIISDMSKENEISIWGYDTDEAGIQINGEGEPMNYSIYYGCKKPEPKLLLYFFLYISIIALIETLKGVNSHEQNKKIV